MQTQLEAQQRQTNYRAQYIGFNDRGNPEWEILANDIVVIARCTGKFNAPEWNALVAQRAEFLACAATAYRKLIDAMTHVIVNCDKCRVTERCDSCMHMKRVLALAEVRS